MAYTQTESKAHNATCNLSESTRQVAVMAAGTGPTAAATVKAADIAHLRNCKASAIANGCSPAPFIAGLQELGVGGA
jgi:hypothetical protein